MEWFFSKYVKYQRDLILTSARGAHALSTVSLCATTVLYWKIGYFKRWNTRADISCTVCLHFFLILRLLGGLGKWPWWKWSPYPNEGATDSQLTCVVQSLLQDIGGFGSFFELLFMSCILFSLEHHIFGFTFTTINTKHFNIHLTIFICVISAIAAVGLLYLRNWCTVSIGNADEFHLNLIHLLFYGSAWLIAGCMTLCAALLYFEKNYEKINTRKIRIRTISETELRVAVGGARDNYNRDRRDVGANIALNIFLLSGCICISTIIQVIAHIHFFINSVEGTQPPVWFAMLAAFFLGFYPATVSMVIVFKSRQYWWRHIRDRAKWCQLMSCCNHFYLWNRCINIRNVLCCDCNRKHDANIKHGENEVDKHEEIKLSPFECEIDVEDVSLSIDVDLVYDYNAHNLMYKIDSSNINNSIEERLFGKNYEGSLTVNDRSSTDWIQSSCVIVSQQLEF